MQTVEEKVGDCDKLTVKITTFFMPQLFVQDWHLFHLRNVFNFQKNYSRIEK